MNAKIQYRIKTANNTFKFAGTGANSWFNLEDARAKVDYSKGEKIVEICKYTGEILWECL